MRPSVLHALLILIVLLAGMGFPSPLSAQRYNFFNYTVNDGLVQSQALAITQDRDGYLWIGTQGGLSRYDGKRFISFAEAGGLASNIVFSLCAAPDGRLWAGTDKGIAVYDKNGFRQINVSNDPQQNIIATVLATSSGRVYARAKGKLYECSTGKAVEELLPGKTAAYITFIALSPSGELWCAALGKGLFIKGKNGWRHIDYPVLKKDQKPWLIRKIHFYGQDTLLLSNSGFYHIEEDSIRPDTFLNAQGWENLSITSISSDAAENLWLGRSAGAMMITPEKKIIRFSSANGLSDTRTESFFRDRENNIWIATDGQGIFRYSSSPFVLYNEKNGLPNPVIMSVIKQADKIWLGTYGGGVAALAAGGIKKYPLPSFNAQHMMSGAVDAQGRYWAGTYNGGLYYYDGRAFRPCINNELLENKVAVGELFSDAHKKVWVATSKGFGRLEGWRYKEIIKTGVAWGFAQAGDEVLIAADGGLFLADQRDSVRTASTLKEIAQYTITGILRDKQNNYWLQTNSHGILIWSREKDTILRHISMTDGLSSNIVYSMLEDSRGNIWIGTGYGLNRLRMSGNYTVLALDKFGRADGMYGMEGNKNALIEGENGLIYYGTTDGLFVYNEQHASPTSEIKEVLLQSVKLFGKTLPGEKEDKNGHHVFRYNEHNLSFDFHAISLRAQGDVEYQYLLQGADTSWSAPFTTSSINFSSLSPGKYKLLIRARAGQTLWCSPLEYGFSIKPPFYQTTIFRTGGILFLLLAGIAIQWWRNKLKARKKSALQQIRREEQDKIRQRTAEDFHDEMGNTLTRIRLLADMLHSKLPAAEKEGVEIAGEIRRNAERLYGDARDIIWSLSPASDNLYEVLERLEYFGNEIFQHTAVKFSMEGIHPSFSIVRLPADYSRNMMLIFKEAMNNTLKHAGASEAGIVVDLQHNRLSIEYADNGSGLAEKQEREGNGIRNMRARALRIGALLDINSGQPSGIRIVFRLNLQDLKK